LPPCALYRRGETYFFFTKHKRILFSSEDPFTRIPPPSWISNCVTSTLSHKQKHDLSKPCTTPGGRLHLETKN
jgi:hypothetical protein